MNIYFGGSIRGGRDDLSLYYDLIRHLGNHGRVLTEHIGSNSLTDKGEHHLDDAVIHNRDIAWLMNADVGVFEVTQTSMGVGYEIGRIVQRNLQSVKPAPLLCLFRSTSDKQYSPMISGCPHLTFRKYTDLSNVKITIDNFFSLLQSDNS